MRKFLVPIDGSESSLRALAFAVERATEVRGATLHVLLVHSPIDVHGKVQIYVSEQKMREMAGEHDQAILHAAEEPLKRSGVAYSMEAAEGHAAEVIARRAQELGCDAIIMGTRGQSRIANLVMGSVATQVIHLTPLPVTLVK